MNENLTLSSIQKRLSGTSVEIEDSINNIVVVNFRSNSHISGATENSLSDLLHILEHISDHLEQKVIVLVGSDENIFNDFNSQKSIAKWRKLQTNIINSKIPIIAAISGDCIGLGWLLALSCDAVVYSDNGNYRFSDMSHGMAIIGGASLIFPLRLGDYFGREILFTGNEYTGSQLTSKSKSFSAAKSEVKNIAISLAEKWTSLNHKELSQLKYHLSHGIIDSIQETIVREQIISTRAQLKTSSNTEAVTVPSEIGESTKIKLKTDIVVLEKYQNGVVCITMIDKKNKNTFTDSLADGLMEAFEFIKINKSCKVAILKGYKTYFACGGSKEGLLSIQNGSRKFTDSRIYSLALECDIPVIACMQGHAIGAGWAMGMFCDFSVFSKESTYVSNYMRYGFTPGAGATLIFPYRFGKDYAREILFTAIEYKGQDFAERGIDMPVIARADTFDYAMRLAYKIATNSSRDALESWKNRLCHDLRSRLQNTLDKEVKMHKKTFVGNSEVLNKILTQYNDTKTKVEVGSSVDIESDESIANIDNDSEIIEILRSSIAEELYLQETEINNDMKFIDMGMDSVTGVTWVRKICEQFGENISATKIYDYPTIISLSEYIKNLLAENKTSSFRNNEHIENTALTSKSGTLSVGQEKITIIKQLLRSSLAEELYMDVLEIDDNIQLVDLGLDSVTGVTWIRKINEELGVTITATKIYDFPTINLLASYINNITGDMLAANSINLNDNDAVVVTHTGVNDDSNDTSEYQHTFENTTKRSKHNISATKNEIEQSEVNIRDTETSTNYRSTGVPEPIAIIGKSGQFPQADDLDQFWTNIEKGKDCITEIPSSRWDMNKFYDSDPEKHAKSYCKHMGVLNNVDKFDPLFFNISPAEAKSIEPQQRLFLENCWSSIEDAAINPIDLSDSRCGVFVGCGISDYGQGFTAQDLMGSAASILSARISYLLNLKGPCIAIDTSCSSSLVAIAEACNSLTLGNSDLAIAGGVCILSGPGMHIMASKAGMLSKDGRCFTFDSRANGFVPGEGVGVLLLKKLSDAVRDGDPISGVIRGWGVNQDGKTNGITAPSVNSQISLEKEVYKKFDINPETITLVEAHGTGTKLGDPIEIEALTESFRSYTNKKGYCALGSVKSNIGHLMPAAGVSGVIKVLMAIKNKKLPPAANFEKANEHLSLEESPFYVNTELKPWNINVDQTRRAAVSSFGFSGTNAHLVIEEFAEPLEETEEYSNVPRALIFPFSAKNNQQLNKLLQRMYSYAKNSVNLNLDDFAYTLQSGREAMNCRIALIADSQQSLIKQLSTYSNIDKINEKSFFTMNTRKNEIDLFDADEDINYLLQSWINKRKLNKIAQLWLTGTKIEWRQLHRSRESRRINIPTYPFADERYWLKNTNSHLQYETKESVNEQIITPLQSPYSGNALLDSKHYSISNKSNVSILPGLIAIVSRITEIPINAIDIDADYEQLGLDSIIIASLSKELETWLGAFDKTLFFKYKSLSTLAEYLKATYSEVANSSYIEKIQSKPTENLKTVTKTENINNTKTKKFEKMDACLSTDDESIAVIGMSGQYPNAKNLQEFWQNLRSAKDCVTEIPIDRFDYRPYFNTEKGRDDTIYSKWGGFLDDIDKFDALFFNVSPSDARAMDPHERLFLETAWECFETAGYLNSKWQKHARNIGVFAGATFNNYQLLAADAFGKEFLAPVDSQIFSIANHVSYFFNLSGPSITIDTACSSSLYAIHLACESIKRGECDLALAGGVNLTLHPSKYFTICARGFAASDGRCHAFSDGGDGYVPSEAVGSVLLKSYNQAIRDNDNILAVIKGTGISHDGKTKNYSVPNPVAQTKAIEAAIHQAKISPETISYVEAHGTGTTLGDPIEIMGLTDAYSKYTEKKQFCAIGSVKSVIGHGEAAAGIAQFTKTLLQIQHKTLVPTLKHGKPNPNIDFENSPFIVQSELSHWDEPIVKNNSVPRRAGISSFGAGGVNVHIIVEEFNHNSLSIEKDYHARDDNPDSLYVIPLSCHVESLMPQIASNLLAWLEDNKRNARLGDIAYTLQSKRAEFRHRLAFLANSLDDLTNQLKNYIDNIGNDELENNSFLEGDSKKKLQVKSEKNDSNIIHGDTAEFDLASEWVSGKEVCWSDQLVHKSLYVCESLPSYPFLKKRYWLTEEKKIPKTEQIENSTSLGLNMQAKSEKLKTCREITLDTSVDDANRSSSIGFFADLLDLSDIERDDKLKHLLEQEIKNVMGFDLIDEIDYEQGFFELGMESMQALKLKQELEKKLLFGLSDTTLFDYPTINSLSEHILGEVSWDSIIGQNTDDINVQEKTSDEADNEIVDDITSKISDMEEDALITELMNELDMHAG